MNELGWKRWREAEAALGRGAAMETAAAKLPPRQAAILRALDALERGDRASIKAAAQATQDLDIGAVLDLVQAAPDKIAPTAVRAALKRGGLSNTPLPMLDLMRAYAVAMSDDFPSSSPVLTKVSRKHLLLSAAMMGLDRSYTWYHLGAPLTACSQRLATIWATAAGITRGDSGPLRKIAALVDPTVASKGVHLDPARWPAAEPRLHGSQRTYSRLDTNTLEVWLKAPLETRWDMGCQDEVEDALQGPRDERRRLLGRLLVALEHVLREGRPHEAIPAVEAALALVAGLSGLPAQDVLQFQLAQLLSRLVWWANDAPHPSLATGLWRMPVPLTEDERRHLAATLLAAIEPQAGDPNAVAEMLVLHYQDPYQVDVSGLGLLMRHARSITPDRLQQGLREAAPWHRNLVLAAHAASERLDVEAFERTVDAWLAPGAAVTAQLDRARIATAAHVFQLALLGLRQGDSRPRKAKERLAAAASRWLEAVAARQIEVDATVLAQCVELAQQLRHLGRPDLEHARIAAVVRQWLTLPSVPGAELALERARLALAIGDEATAESGFRALGRFLREAPKEPAIETALRWCAEMQSTEDAEPEPALARWRKALDAWLLQQPKPLLGSTALALAKAEPKLAEPLFDWGLETLDESDWSAPWDALEQVMLMDIDLDGPDFDDMFPGDIDFEAALEKLSELTLGGIPPRPPSRRPGPAPRQKGRSNGGRRG